MFNQVQIEKNIRLKETNILLFVIWERMQMLMKKVLDEKEDEVKRKRKPM